MAYEVSGNQVYVGAGVAAVLENSKKDKKLWKQSFFNVHANDVVSFAMHPSRTVAATGQMASPGKAKAIDIYVWDVETKEIMGRFNDFHRRAIVVLSFSKSGQFLGSIGQDDDNSLAIYEWKTKRLVVTSNVDKAKVNGFAWKNDNEFATVGMKHIKFWTLTGRNLKSTMGQQSGGGKFES